MELWGGGLDKTLTRKKPDAAPDPDPKPEPPKDAFVGLLQETIEAMLKDTAAAYKDRVALITNAIKFLLVKNRIEGSADGSFFGDDADD